jgi:hypothetical protein
MNASNINRAITRLVNSAVLCHPANRISWVAISLLCALLLLVIDLQVGPIIRLPILFIFPVAAASWFGGWKAGAFISICMPAFRLIVEKDLIKPWTFQESLINTAILIAAFLLISGLISYIHQQRNKIKILQGFIPICSFCKKIRTEDKWVQMESYITHNSEATFTHGLCPECARKHYAIENANISGTRSESLTERSFNAV